jgi:hypothetical protein
MKALNVTKDQLEEALRLTNERYDQNVIWNREPEPTNKKETSWRFTLRVRDSSGPGARRSAPLWHQKRRKLIAACWHVHGHFFEHLFELCPELKLRVATHNIDHPNEIWLDQNIGSQMYPYMYSDACECSEN